MLNGKYGFGEKCARRKLIGLVRRPKSMRLKTNKTWSQQQLAIKLRVGPAQNAGIFSWEHKRLLIHAAKTSLAAALCWWLALRFGLHDGYWGSISAIIVLQSNVGSTVTASRDRILGTLIGAALGFSFSLLGRSRGITSWRSPQPSFSAGCCGCATVRGWRASPLRL